VGITWFSRIGMVALVLGVSFFLKYAFDSGWIGETGRVMIGIVIGLTLLGFGEKFIRKYFGYGQILTGGGIVVLYLSLFSAFNFYHLVEAPTAFVFMAIVTAIGVLLSVRYNALTLMVTSVIGGFATPMMVSTGTNQQVALFSYILLLDLAVLGVSVFKRWHEVHFIGAIGTVLLFSGWYGSFYTVAQLWSTFFFLTLFFLVYSLSALVYNLYKKEKSTGTEQILTLFAGFIYFGASYGMLDREYHAFMGFFALIMAIYYFLWAYLVRALTPTDDKLYGFLAVLSAGFIALAVPIQFKQNIITLAWLVEAVILIYVGIQTKNKMVKGFGVVIAGLAFLRLILVDWPPAQNAMAIFNERFFTYAFAVAVFYLIGLLWKKATGDERELLESKKLAALFFILANFLTLSAGSIEISYFYQNQIQTEQNKITLSENSLEQIKYGNTRSENYADNYQIINDLENKKDVTRSIFWILYALALTFAGISRVFLFLRNSGTVILILSIFKLFLIDQWVLSPNTTVIFNERFIIYLFGVMALYVAGLLWTRWSIVEESKKYVGAFLILANFFTLYAGSVEIESYYERQIQTEQATIAKTQEMANQQRYGSQNQLADTGNYKTNYDTITKLGNKSSVSLSLFWILYSILLLVVGITKKLRFVRIGGLLLLLVAILKLFFYDLWSLGTLYRIISSMTLGVVLLSVSYAYQRFKDKIKNII
jgi:uncharacterized membrane protein